jgi:hypothetical protein
MVDLIEREFNAAGYDRPIIVAAVTNSYVESRKWDPLEHTWGPEYKRTGKKTEDSAGLFQLNRMGGHGEGMPMGTQYPVGPSSKKGDSRYDPVLNIRRILEVMRRSTDFSIAQYNFGHDAVKMAGEFCKIIEKPATAKERPMPTMRNQNQPEAWSVSRRELGVSHASRAAPTSAVSAKIAMLKPCGWAFQKAGSGRMSAIACCSRKAARPAPRAPVRSERLVVIPIA